MHLNGVISVLDTGDLGETLPGTSVRSDSGAGSSNSAPVVVNPTTYWLFLEHSARGALSEWLISGEIVRGTSLAYQTTQDLGQCGSPSWDGRGGNSRSQY